MAEEGVKVIILAGGLGTRLAEETEVRPKPMVEIGGRPILWHIMKQYSHFGFKEFFFGYKSFFADCQEFGSVIGFCRQINLAANRGQAGVLLRKCPSTAGVFLN